MFSDFLHRWQHPNLLFCALLFQYCGDDSISLQSAILVYLELFNLINQFPGDRYSGCFQSSFTANNAAINAILHLFTENYRSNFQKDNHQIKVYVVWQFILPNYMPQKPFRVVTKKKVNARVKVIDLKPWLLHLPNCVTLGYCLTSLFFSFLICNGGNKSTIHKRYM